MNAAAVLILARTFHLIAILQLAGLALALVALPRPARALATMRRLACAGLAVALASGAGWVAVQTAHMSGQAVTADTLATVLGHTQFGQSFTLRAALLAMLTMLLIWGRWRWLAVALAAAAAATLAWGGHASTGEGLAGRLHLTSDVIHLLAAAAWLGGLLPLALVLHHGDTAACTLAARRFSRLGMAAVLAVAASGLGNAYVLIGSLAGLLGTPYGHLLLVKLALFAAMLTLAAYNRQILTPRLVLDRAPLIRNTVMEATLAAVLLGVVGALGTLPPAMHSEARWPLPYRLDGGHLMPATPMSFARPATALTTDAVAQGRRLYGQACASCHPSAPQTLNQGDTYWWATQGHAAPPLTDPAQGWSVVHFLTTRAQNTVSLSPEIGPGVPAPDFDFETLSGDQGSLAGEAVTLLVFYDDSRLSHARLNQLALRRPALEAEGRRILAIPLQSPTESELSVIVAPEVVKAYGVLLPDLTSHTELLVDRIGWLRARWRPNDVLDWRAAKLLSRQLDALTAEADPARHRH